jgi:hypothetical protein
VFTNQSRAGIQGSLEQGANSADPRVSISAATQIQPWQKEVTVVGSAATGSYEVRLPSLALSYGQVLYIKATISGGAAVTIKDENDETANSEEPFVNRVLNANNDYLLIMSVGSTFQILKGKVGGSAL